MVREDLNLEPNEEIPNAPKVPEQVEKFFAESSEQLTALRDLLKELNRVGEAAIEERNGLVAFGPSEAIAAFTAST